MRSSRLFLGSALGLFALGGGCAPVPEQEADGPEPEVVGEAVQAVTVAEAAGGCSTSAVKGLSLQIIEQAACLQPGSFVEVPAGGNLTYSDTVLPYLEQPARDGLLAALAENPGTAMQVNSMLRTVAQQYLLYRWYVNGECGIALAATPGNSNHETGLALDVQQYNAWKAPLTAHGFKWYGANDTVHFDYVGPGAVSYKGADVLAFQVLWNKNHPGDVIAEDGDYGPQTEARLKQSPAGGFAIGPDCNAVAPQPDLQPALVFVDAADDFEDGASAGRVDLFEGDDHAVSLTLTNGGGAPAANVQIALELTEPFLGAFDYYVESDYGHPGTFEENDANTDPANPDHGAELGPAFELKLNAFAKGETKRVTFTVRGQLYSIEKDAAPEVRFWVKDVPGAYHQEAYGGPVDNVGGSQTWNGGVLQAAVAVDVLSRTQWLWDTDRREGWGAAGGAEIGTHPEEGLLSIGAEGAGLWAQSGPVGVAADEFGGVEISARVTGGGQAYLYFATVAEPELDETRRLAFTGLDAEGFATASLNAGEDAGWTGTITRLGLGVDGGGLLEVDSLRLVPLGEGEGEGEGGSGGGGVGAGGDGGGAGGNLDDTQVPARCSCEVPGSSGRGDGGGNAAALGLVALGIAAMRRSRRRG